LKPEAYEATVEVVGIDVLTENNGNTRFDLLWNPAWSGTALVWVDLPNSHLQQATAAGNNLITSEGIVLGTYHSSGETDQLGVSIESKLRLGKNLQANANQLGRYDVICLAGTAKGGNEVYEASINYRDF
jgi:hypothetical protein